MNRLLLLIIVLVSACSSRLHAPDAEALKPTWLRDQPYREGYYTGIGHSRKDAAHNYIQAAKKSALDDLVSQIKVNVASTSILSFFETARNIREEYAIGFGVLLILFGIYRGYQYYRRYFN